MNWYEYQEQAAQLFRDLGLQAETNVRVQGIRTHHNVDVRVISRHAGFDVTWLVECKQWASPVSKLHVLALREIVADTGADRGILLSESGAQSGAHEAAVLTNVRITSLAEIRSVAELEINMARLCDVFDRIAPCKAHYWEIPKDVRIDYGLRPGLFEDGYSGQFVIRALEDVVGKALRGRFPFPVEFESYAGTQGVPQEILSSQHAIDVASQLVSELENRLAQPALQRWIPGSNERASEPAI